MCFPFGNAEALHVTVRCRAAGQDGGLAQVRADSAHFTGAALHGLTRPSLQEGICLHFSATSLLVISATSLLVGNFPVGQQRICL
jgi:hypothetical protein